jgi:GTPase
VSDPSINNLNHIRHEYRAENGTNGSGNGCYGMKGKDLKFNLPLGTLIYKLDPSGNGRKILLDECIEPDKYVLIAKGGKGGRGNRSMRTNNHTHEKGYEGEEFQIELDMNSIADVGLVGQPNSGKSSFLACVSRSSPKIASYPFTTLHPNIGIVTFENQQTISIADVPGLIEGAHQNIGLGHEFLKHVRKSKNLILVIDASTQDPINDAHSVINEINLYQNGLSDKIFLILINKIDRIRDCTGLTDRFQQAFPFIKSLPISAKYNLNLKAIFKFLQETNLINER